MVCTFDSKEMIGIDLTKISRFDRINLNRLGHKLGHKLDDSTSAAKTWACLEAITKAEQHKISPKNLKLVFERNKPPVVLDPNNTLSGEYVLSLTHEDGYVVAVAFRKN
jgi:phosphopantetheinyl transferase (holo-ACP synthase)